jgi:hypothetical protein
MRKTRTRAAVALTALSLGAMGVVGPGAFASITTSSNNGHPSTNPTGKCPTGQNKGATPGALNKCS